MSAMPLPDQVIDRINAALSAAGPQEPLLVRLLEELAEVVSQQRFVVDEALWLRVSRDNRFALQFLDAVTGESVGGEWFERQLFDAPALEWFRSFNDGLHQPRIRPSVTGLRAAVAEAQGFDRCVLCGSTLDIEVDHIIPFARGGNPDSLTNLQLLCRLCNRGKSALEDELLPRVITTRKGSTISDTARFKRLYVNAQRDGARYVGHCGCGQSVRENDLQVVLAVADGAANFLNLTVQCSTCRKV